MTVCGQGLWQFCPVSLDRSCFANLTKVVLKYAHESGVCSRPGERFQIQWQESGKRKWVKRFNLLFEDESIDDFKSRIQAALRRRQEVERDARYKAYVQQQKWRNMDTLDQGFQERVMHLAGRELPLKLPALTHSFLDEVMTTSTLYRRRNGSHHLLGATPHITRDHYLIKMCMLHITLSETTTCGFSIA